jgi:uncharacterized HAD superfamily protein
MSTYKPESRVAFDIDGIVLDTATAIWRAVTSHYDIPASIESWKEYYIEKQLGIPQQDVRPVYEPVMARTDLPMLKGAAKTLKEFYAATQEPILFITARRPQFVAGAAASIKREIPDVEIEIIAASESAARLGDNKGHDKTAFLKDHGIGFFIDDHPYSWEKYMNAGICVGTIDWPWTRANGLKMLNGGYDNQFVMFKDWDEIRDFLMLTLGAKNFVENHKEFTL